MVVWWCCGLCEGAEGASDGVVDVPWPRRSLCVCLRLLLSVGGGRDGGGDEREAHASSLFFFLLHAALLSFSRSLSERASAYVHRAIDIAARAVPPERTRRAKRRKTQNSLPRKAGRRRRSAGPRRPSPWRPRACFMLQQERRDGRYQIRDARRCPTHTRTREREGENKNEKCLLRGGDHARCVLPLSRTSPSGHDQGLGAGPTALGDRARGVGAGELHLIQAKGVEGVWSAERKRAKGKARRSQINL